METIKIEQQQYFGCMPITAEEKFLEKLKQVTLDKKAAFKSLSNAKKTENDCCILKEQLQKEFQLLEEYKNTNYKDNNTQQLQEETKTLKLEVNTILLINF